MKGINPLPRLLCHLPKATVMTRLLAFWMLSTVCGISSAQNSITIDLGGPRKAKVVIIEDGNSYDIEVSMIPVRSFDAGMNRRLSQEKASYYAKAALIRHLSSGKRLSATISISEVVEARIADARFILVLRVPLKGVRLVEPTDAKLDATPAKVVASGSIVRSKDDCQNTLEVIIRTLTDDLPRFEGNRDAFDRAVSETEELGVTRLELLRKDVKSDRWLLSTERDELLESVAAEEMAFLDRLRQRVEEVETLEKERAADER